MNLIDILLVLPLLYGLYTGYSKGIIAQLTGIIGGIIAILFGIKLSGYLKLILIDQQWVNPQWGGVVGFVVTILGIFLVLKLAGYMAKKGTRWVGLGFLEKMIGAIFGVGKWALIEMVLLFFFVKVNQYLDIIPTASFDQSMLYPFFQEGINILYELANPIITQA